jgi:hypothetical protein
MNSWKQTRLFLSSALFDTSPSGLGKAQSTGATLAAPDFFRCCGSFRLRGAGRLLRFWNDSSAKSGGFSFLTGNNLILF